MPHTSSTLQRIRVVLPSLVLMACGSSPNLPSPPPEPPPRAPGEAQVERPEASSQPPTAQRTVSLCSEDGWCIQDAGWHSFPMLPLAGATPVHVRDGAAHVLVEGGLLHFDGQAWSRERIDEELVAVGGDPLALLTRDGRILTRVDDHWMGSEGAATAARYMEAWIRSPDDVWAVQVPTSEAIGQAPPLLHWNGRAWEDPGVSTRFVGAELDVAAYAPGCAIVAGRTPEGRRAVRVERDALGRWTTTDLAGPEIDALATTGERVLAASGGSILRLVQDRWEVVHRERSGRGESRMAAQGEQIRVAVWAPSPRDRTNDPDMRRVLASDGAAWTLSEGELLAHQLFLLGGLTVATSYWWHGELAVGRGAELVRRPRLRAVWAYAQDAAYAVGDHGTILGFDGERWNAEASPTDVALNDVFGVDGETVFAVGNGGTVLRRSGGAWTVLDAPTERDLVTGWASSSEHLYVAGVGGDPGEPTAFELVDGSWRPLTGSMAHASGVAAGPDGAAFGWWGADVLFGAGAAAPPSCPIGAVHNAWQGERGLYVTSSFGPRVARYAHGAWQVTDLSGPLAQGNRVTSVHGSASTTFAVTAAGRILREADGRWIEMQSGVRWPLEDVYVLDDGSAWAVGAAGLILHRAAAR